jgi:hypothetical protein
LQAARQLHARASSIRAVGVSACESMFAGVEHRPTFNPEIVVRFELVVAD